jgi:hypothetical protein
VTERPEDRGEREERARIRGMLLERGVPPSRITQRLIDFWIVQDANDEEEGRILGYRRPSRWFFGGGG